MMACLISICIEELPKGGDALREKFLASCDLNPVPAVATKLDNDFD